MRILMQNRGRVYKQPGGDTVLMDRTAEGLRKLGVEVVIDIVGDQDPRKFDLVHVFNFALPKLIKAVTQNAHALGVPFVVTTLCEDIEKFDEQSLAIARLVVDYVNSGQDKEWWQLNKLDISNVKPAAMFDNQWAATHAAALLTNGSEESRVVRKYYGQDVKVREVPLGCDLGIDADPSLFINEYGLKDFILCVGRLELRKNQLMLMKALEDSDLDLVIAAGGFSYQAEYEETVNAFKRKGRTLILGRLSNEMLASAYAAAKVHVLPSWYELPGLVSLEAARYGCNVVVTENGTSRDYFGDKAFYCRPEDENSILNAVLAAYYSPVKQGLKELAESTSWEKTAMETYKTYQEVLGVKQDIKIQTPVVTPPEVHGGYDLAPLVNDCQEILEKGEIAAREKDFTTATSYLNQVLQINPQSVRAMVALGAISLAQSKVDEALVHFEKGEQLDPDNSKVLSGRGMCLMMKGEPEAAHGYFYRALLQDPFDQIAILQLIEASYSIERFEELSEVLDKFTTANPENIDMNFCFAGCLYRLGEIEQSEAINNQVLKAMPLHQGATELAAALKQTPRADSSVNRETKIIESQQEIQQPVWTVGDEVPGFSIEDRLFELEYMKRDRKTVEVIQGANDILNNSTANNAQKEQAALLLAEIEVLEERLESAQEIYNEILSKNPNSARAITGVGAIRANLGKWEEAKKCFENAAELDPNYDVPFAGLGLYHTWKQELDVAWDLYHEALKRNPENQRAVLGAIEIGFAQSKFDKVETIIREWLDHKPGDLDLIYSLAGCLYSQGKTDEACSELEKVFIFNPEHASARELYQTIKQQNVSSSGVYTRES